MKIAIVNGPNLNLLGKREPGIYGNLSFDQFFPNLEKKYPQIFFTYLQSNIEGEIVTAIQKYGFESDGIILNPGAYTHTSIAIGDAIAAVPTKIVEVHISNIFNREEFRKHSFVSAKAVGVISGLGLKGYELALLYFLQDHI